MATEMVLGKPVDEAYQITEQAVAEALGGIPEYKMRCSNLAPAAIRNAIDDWRRRVAGHPGEKADAATNLPGAFPKKVESA
jgi:nitrogen fixation NifU-like protein